MNVTHIRMFSLNLGWICPHGMCVCVIFFLQSASSGMGPYFDIFRSRHIESAIWHIFLALPHIFSGFQRSIYVTFWYIFRGMLIFWGNENDWWLHFLRFSGVEIFVECWLNIRFCFRVIRFLVEWKKRKETTFDRGTVVTGVEIKNLSRQYFVFRLRTEFKSSILKKKNYINMTYLPFKSERLQNRKASKSK